MNWDNNPYYRPEKFGLTQVAEIDRGGGYEFDLIVMWRHESGQFYMGADAGCSCPTPFDGISKTSDLTPVTTLADVMRELKACEQSYGPISISESAAFVQAWQKSRAVV